MSKAVNRFAAKPQVLGDQGELLLLLARLPRRLLRELAAAPTLQRRHELLEVWKEQEAR